MSTNAIKVKVIKVSGSNRPVFRYTILDGTEIQKVSMMKDVSFRKGQVIALKCNPKKPRQYVINNGSTFTVLGGFLIVVGSIFFVIFLFLFVFALRY